MEETFNRLSWTGQNLNGLLLIRGPSSRDIWSPIDRLFITNHRWDQPLNRVQPGYNSKRTNAFSKIVHWMLLWSTAHMLERFCNQKTIFDHSDTSYPFRERCLRHNETIVLCRNHQEERKERQWHRWNVSKPPLWWLWWRSCAVNKRRSVRVVNWSQQWETEPNFVESQESNSPHCQCVQPVPETVKL